MPLLGQSVRSASSLVSVVIVSPQRSGWAEAFAGQNRHDHEGERENQSSPISLAPAPLC
jgi:hypothetical protein